MSKIDINITYFAFFPGYCRVFKGVLRRGKKRKGREREGEGRRRRGRITCSGHFGWSLGEHLPHRLRDDLGKQRVLIMVKFRSRRCITKLRFSVEKQHFSPNRTLMLATASRHHPGHLISLPQLQKLVRVLNLSQQSSKFSCWGLQGCLLRTRSRTRLQEYVPCRPTVSCVFRQGARL